MNIKKIPIFMKCWLKEVVKHHSWRLNSPSEPSNTSSKR